MRFYVCPICLPFKLSKMSESKMAKMQNGTKIVVSSADFKDYAIICYDTEAKEKEMNEDSFFAIFGMQGYWFKASIQQIWEPDETGHLVARDYYVAL